MIIVKVRWVLMEKLVAQRGICYDHNVIGILFSLGSNLSDVSCRLHLFMMHMIRIEYLHQSSEAQCKDRR